jgi:agarase
MQGRVDAYEKYVVSALKNPAIAGAHWFRWLDQPTTGRCGDGENYSVGMVDICDTPVYPMIKKAHELSTKLYDVRTKSSTKK